MEERDTTTLAVVDGTDIGGDKIFLKLCFYCLYRFWPLCAYCENVHFNHFNIHAVIKKTIKSSILSCSLLHDFVCQ